MTIEILEKEMLKLPVKARVQLLETGLASLGNGPIHFEEEWIAESLRREELAEKGEIPVRNIEDVLAAVFPKK